MTVTGLTQSDITTIANLSTPSRFHVSYTCIGTAQIRCTQMYSNHVTITVRLFYGDTSTTRNVTFDFTGTQTVTLSVTTYSRGGSPQFSIQNNPSPQSISIQSTTYNYSCTVNTAPPYSSGDIIYSADVQFLAKVIAANSSATTYTNTNQGQPIVYPTSIRQTYDISGTKNNVINASAINSFLAPTYTKR